MRGKEIKKSLTKFFETQDINLLARISRLIAKNKKLFFKKNNNTSLFELSMREFFKKDLSTPTVVEAHLLLMLWRAGINPLNELLKRDIYKGYQRCLDTLHIGYVHRVIDPSTMVQIFTAVDENKKTPISYLLQIFDEKLLDNFLKNLPFYLSEISHREYLRNYLLPVIMTRKDINLLLLYINHLCRTFIIPHVAFILHEQIINLNYDPNPNSNFSKAITILKLNAPLEWKIMALQLLTPANYVTKTQESINAYINYHTKSPVTFRSVFTMFTTCAVSRDQLQIEESPEVDEEQFIPRGLFN